MLKASPWHDLSPRAGVRARADIVMTRTAANVEKISTAAGAIAARRLGEMRYGLDVHQWHVWAVCPALGIVWSLREVGSERLFYHEIEVVLCLGAPGTCLAVSNLKSKSEFVQTYLTETSCFENV